MKLRLLLLTFLFSALSWGQYAVDFDGASDGTSATAYGFTGHSLNGITWDGVQVIIPTTPLTADWFNGARSLRSRGHGVSEFTMTSDKTNGIGTISFDYRSYGTDGQTDHMVEYSTDSGSTWTQIGANFLGTGSVQTFSEIVNISGNVRIRIRTVTTTGTSNRRLNIDDINITDFAGSTDQMDWCNVQSPATGTITAGANFNVYAKGYELGVTEAPGPGTGITAWIGYNTVNNDPSTVGWTWIPATFNVQVVNDDEFVAEIGSGLAPGTYYYASRFQLNGGPFTYGGYNGGFWDGITNINGVLTVNPSVVDFCNVQFPANGTIAEGSNFTVYAQVYEPGITDAAGQGAGITAWIGYSTTDIDPSTGSWTWIPATYNVDSGNNDEYQTEIGSGLTFGTYYYASRFQLGTGVYRYGGYNGGFWDGTTNVNGVLTVTAPPVITSSLTASGTVGAAFSYDIIATNSPTSYNATGLPAGLSVNISTGQITGTPSGTGTFNVTISATNAYGTDTQTLVITITTGPCLSEPTFTATPSGWSANSVTYAAGEANFAGFTGDLTTITVSNPTSLTFDLRRTGNTSAKDMIIEISTISQTGPFTTVATYNHGNTTSSSTTNCTVDLSAYTANATVYIRFRKASSTTSPWYLSNVSVFCGTPPDVEIDIQGNGVSIVDGSTSPSLTDDTDFGTTTIGNDITHTFTIYNTGTDPLDISNITITGINAADFYISVNPASTVAASGSTTFEITYSPSASGTSNATITIANNDADENSFTFDIIGNATVCSPSTSVSSIAPATGPVGTVVTINGSGFTTATVVSFGAFSATFTIVSDSVIEAIVPANAVTATITIQDAGGCNLNSLLFNVITKDNSSCEGIAVTTDLIIYDIHDEYSGSGGFITIYNGTATTVDLTDYSIWRTSNYGDGNEVDYATTSGSIASGALGILKVSPASCGPASTNGTIDNGFNEDDGIQLRSADGLTIIDDVHTYVAGPGYYMVRNAGAYQARTTYVASDWNTTTLIAGECYPSAGLVPPSNGNSPTVTLNPVNVNASCSSTTATFTVAGTEGVSGGLALAYQWYVNIPGNSGWTALSDGGVYTGTTTSTLNISSTSGLNNYQYYCQIRENDATCFTATEAAIIKDGSTVWNGTSWSNGVPDSTMLATINGNYDTTLNGNIECCSLVINSTFALDIQANDYVEIQNDLTVNGTLNVLNNGSLVQINDSGVNTGNINYSRSTSGNQYDYVYWSSPVEGVNTPAGYIYSWSPAIANTNGGLGNWVYAGNTSMLPGVGYIMRDVFSNTFSGVARNGVIQPSIARGGYTGPDYFGNNGITITQYSDNWNLIGNPYPSSINVLDFLTLNTNIEGSVRIWTHSTSPSSSNTNPFYNSFVVNYTASDYITHNGTGTVSGPIGFNGFIAGGQSFLVNMLDGAATSSTVTFNNSLRNKAYDNTQFYKTVNIKSSNLNVEKNRIWLDIVDNVNQAERTLIGYVSNATYDKDRLYDAIIGVENNMKIYSIINNERMIVQGRQLPFDNQDIVQLGVFIPNSNNYTIAIHAVDGLFNGSQEIYLEDKDLNLIHDLKLSPYNFYSTAGEFKNRFVLRYTNSTLTQNDFEINDQIAINTDENISISSNNLVIDEILIYNVLGQKIYSNKRINSNNISINSISKLNQALVVKIIFNNRKIITKKIIF